MIHPIHGGIMEEEPSQLAGGPLGFTSFSATLGQQQPVYFNMNTGQTDSGEPPSSHGTAVSHHSQPQGSSYSQPQGGDYSQPQGSVQTTHKGCLEGM